VLAVGAVASLITTIAGTYPVPPLALGVLMMALTIIVGATTRAIENKNSDDRLKSLSVALSAALLTLGGIWVYHSPLDPSRKPSGPYEMLLMGEDAQVAHPAARPGSESSFNFPGVVANRPTYVDCYATDDRGGRWYRLTLGHGFLPVDLFQPAPGQEETVPEC
jgi:hypothetical protein